MQMEKLANMNMTARRATFGFTLIELMIVVAIIGVLAAIAFPSYETYVIKSNRRATQAFMLDVANREKQYFLDARSYLDVANNAAFTNLGMTVPTEVSKYYDMTVAASAAATPPTFTVSATPIAGKKQANDGTLTLTQDGTKAPADKW